MPTSRISRCFLAPLWAVAAAVVLPFVLSAQSPDAARVAANADRVLEAAARNGSTSPGCAVGISLDGRSVYERAYGLADLEHAIPNTPDTIFESGSVAKQFTAAAVVQLALDGKLGLDDEVRTYVPELPDYGAPLTIRHLLNHTGGVRDWGAVLALTGSGRGDRVVTQELALDVIVHQRALDFTPGAEYSYSNSGYTLLSTIVERVSGQSLPAFTEARFFQPLEMTHSSWRDDYRTVVPGRAQAYSGQGSGPWRLNMPIMNVYGNGGMLTTVGDWLRWNAMLDSRSLGAELVEALETTGVLNDGRPITYALGLTVNTYKGQRQVAHGGSTAGYQTYLARYPDLKLSVAVMCNVGSGAPAVLAHQLVDAVAGPFPEPSTPEPERITLGAEALRPHASLWRHDKTHMPIETVVQDGSLRVAGGPVLRPLRDGSFQAGQGATRWRFEPGSNGGPAVAIVTTVSDIDRYVAETAWSPTPVDLEAFAGEWHSDEADATLSVVVDGAQAFLVQRPVTRRPLEPVFADHFTIGNNAGNVMWFTRDAAGQVTTLHVGAGRMRDMPFARSRR